MLDIRLFRDDPGRIRTAMQALQADAPIDEIIRLDDKRRNILGDSESLKAQRNEGSKQVRNTHDPAARQQLIEDMRAIGDRIDAYDDELREVEDSLREKMLQVPNLPQDDVPVGADESENVIVFETGAKPKFDFEPIPHWEMAEKLGTIDFDRGVKVAGTRFYILRGDGARLQRALIAWMIDFHIARHGYQEIYPPYFTTEEMLVGTGQLPKFGDGLYRDISEDKWLIPTGEVPITNMYRDEIIDESMLPMYHVAYTACFRREQISAGKEVRGIKRGYQFDKVEMVKFVHPDKSIEEHERLIQEAAETLEALELPYRRVQMCTGDLSFTAANKVDLELWAAGSNEWLEVSSCSNFCDFQARRANLRFRPKAGGRPQFLHTLNGSGLALPRTVIGLMEHNQLEDGSFRIPEVLRPYMNGQTTVGVQPTFGPASIP